MKALLKVNLSKFYFCEIKNNLQILQNEHTKIESINKNKNYLKTNKLDQDSTANDFKTQINQKIFDKIFTENKADVDDKNLIKFDSLQGNLINSDFSTNLERNLYVKDNAELSELILNNKLDLTNEKIKIKSLNLSDKELNEKFNNELVIFI